MEKNKETAGDAADDDVTQRFRSPVEDSFYESFVIRSRSNVGSLYAANLSSSQQHVQRVKFIEREKYVQLSSMEKGQREMLKKMERLKTAQEKSRRKSLGALPRREHTLLGRTEEVFPSLRRGSAKVPEAGGENKTRFSASEKYKDLQREEYRNRTYSMPDNMYGMQAEREINDQVEQLYTGKKWLKPLRTPTSEDTYYLSNYKDRAPKETILKSENRSESQKKLVHEEPKTWSTPSESGPSHVRFLPQIPSKDNTEDEYLDNGYYTKQGALNRRSQSSLSQRSTSAVQPQRSKRSMSVGSTKDWEQIIQKTSQLKSDTRHSMVKKDIKLSTKTKYIPQTFRTGSTQDAVQM